MIGQFYRSSRQLAKNIPSNGALRILFNHGGQVFSAMLIRDKQKNSDDESIFFINNLTGERSFNSTISSETQKRILDIMSKDDYRSFCQYNSNRREFLRGIASWGIMLPLDFDAQYEKFLANNGKIKRIIASMVGNYNAAISKYLFALFGESPNTFLWAITLWGKQALHHSFFLRISNFLENYSQVVKNLKRGSITSYTTTPRISELIDEITIITREKRAKDAIKTFNTTQKKILNGISLTQHQTSILSRFQSLSDVKRRNFVRKMSTIDNVDEIFHQMTLATHSTFDWSKNSLLDYIKNSDNMKCKVVFDKDNIVVVQVDDFNTIKYLAKTTNWCISKNKSYWNNYLYDGRNATQFMLFDFDKKEDDDLSIVGFTINKSSCITAAHSFTNKNLLNREDNSESKLKSFLYVISPSNIYNILKIHGITIQDLLGGVIGNPRYDWNSESFVNFLNFALEGDDNYSLYRYDEDVVAFTTSHDNIRFIFNDNAKEYFRRNQVGTKYFVVADFTKESNASNRLLLTTTFRNRMTSEESADVVCDSNGFRTNMSFEEVLTMYGLPFDIICRPNDDITVLKSYFTNFNIDGIKNSLDSPTIKEILLSKKNNTLMQVIYQSIKISIINYKSFDIINMLYESGFKLSDIISDMLINDLVESLVFTINRISAERARGWTPSKNDIKRFFSTITNDDANTYKRMVTGFVIALQRIVNNEKDNLNLIKFASTFDYDSLYKTTTNCLLMQVMPYLDIAKAPKPYGSDGILKAINQDSMVAKYWLEIYSNNPQVIEMIKGYEKAKPVGKKVSKIPIWADPDPYGMVAADRFINVEDMAIARQ